MSQFFTKKNVSVAFRAVVAGFAIGAVGSNVASRAREDIGPEVAPYASNNNTDPCKDPANDLKFVFENKSAPVIMGEKTVPVFSEDASGTADKYYRMLGRQVMLMHNPDNAAAMNTWLSQLDPWRTSSIADRARAVDALIDKTITYTKDEILYGKKNDDYWAAPVETLSRLKGDCEDFAFLKYEGMRYLGVPASHLYGLMVNYDNDKKETVGHLVLVVDINESAGQPPKFRILDNDSAGLLVEESARKNYRVAYAMNEQGYWAFPKNTAAQWKPGPGTPPLCIPSPKPAPVAPGNVRGPK